MVGVEEFDLTIGELGEQRISFRSRINSKICYKPENYILNLWPAFSPILLPNIDELDPILFSCFHFEIVPYGCCHAHMLADEPLRMPVIPVELDAEPEVRKVNIDLKIVADEPSHRRFNCRVMAL